MKNKLYYLLAVLYILMLGFILYINGVFTGEVTSISNLLINGGFLLIIGILFMMSFVSFGRLNQVTDALCITTDEILDKYQSAQQNLWTDYRKKKEAFPNGILNEQFRKYQNRVAAHTNTRGVVMDACSIEDYINEELLDQVGKTYFNSAVSGTLTGLGILGTFLGLTMGMSSFSGNDIFTISDNIAPLLDGMKVAFHTSVYGIFFSLVFNFVYRSLMADAYEKLADFTEVFKEYVAPEVNTTDENTRAMLIYQANMANSLKAMLELLRGNAMEQTKGVEQIVNSFTSRLSESMGADFGNIGKALNQACTAQETYAQNFRRLEESTKMLLEASQAMSDTMHQTLEEQNRIEEQLSKTCEDLSNELYTFQQMRNLYEE